MIPNASYLDGIQPDFTDRIIHQINQGLNGFPFIDGSVFTLGCYSDPIDEIYC
jgi:hypothetical protein